MARRSRETGPLPSGTDDPHVGLLEPLLGREDELAAVMAALRPGAVVSITGLGGVGKTRLAQEAALLAADRGSWVRFVDLAAARDEAAALAVLARAVGVRETTDIDLVTGAVTALRVASRPLVVLDNLEQLAGASRLVVRLLSAVPELTLLATSRRRLGVVRERELPLGPLALPLDDTPSAVQASPSAALLLARSAATVGRPTRLADADAGDVARLCRLLDGIPLAIELAASRLRIMSVAALNRLLQDREPVLPAGPREGRASLEAVLRWSLDALDPPDRAFLRRVAVCPAGFDLDMARAIGGSSDVLASIDALVSLGLVRPGADPDEPRYRLLETVRAFALDPDDTELVDARRTHALHVLDRYRDARDLIDAGALARGLARVRGLESDEPTAIAWLERSQAGDALALASAAASVSIHRGVLREPIARLKRLLAAAPPDHPERARGLLGLGELVQRVDGESAALPILRQAVASARHGDDVGTEALALYQLGFLSANVGDIETAETSAAALGAIAEARDDSLLRGKHVSILGGIASIRKDWDAVCAMSLAAASFAAEVGDDYRTGISFVNASMALLEAGRPAEAAPLAEQGLALMGDLSAGVIRVGCEAFVSIARLEAGDREQARLGLNAAASRAAELDSTELRLWICVAAIPYLLAVGTARLAGQSYGVARRSTIERSRLASAPLDLIDRRFEQARRGRDGGEVGIGLRLAERTDLSETVRAIADATATSRPLERRYVRHGRLTAREVEVLGLVADGRSDAEIAAALRIRPKTASVHVANAKAKLGVASRLEAALEARQLGIRGPA